MSEVVASGVLGLTAKIVSAYVGHNTISVEALPLLIQAVYTSLAIAGTREAAPEPLVPAVAIKKSVFSDFIICLEDGKKLKMLKRHLQSSYGLTPNEYRRRWGLPPDYPMVAPSYANHRSTLAQAIGLGRKPAAGARETSDSVKPAPVVKVVPERRAKGSKGQNGQSCPVSRPKRRTSARRERRAKVNWARRTMPARRRSP